MLMLWTLAACDPPDDGTTAPDDSTVDEAPECSGGGGAEVGYAFYEVGGESYWLYVPPSATECAPLLLFGHGGGNNGMVRDGFWQDPMGTLLPFEAEERGFAFLVPFLVDSEGMQEHGWSLDLVEPMEAMIADAATRYDLDLSKVMFAGTSAGGHMACYWGLYEPRGVTSVTVLSAGIGGYFDYPDPEPETKLPFIVIHDPDDEIVPYRYSKNLAEDLEEHGHEYVFEDLDLGSNGHGWTHDATELVLDTWLGE